MPRRLLRPWLALRAFRLLLVGWLVAGWLETGRMIVGWLAFGWLETGRMAVGWLTAGWLVVGWPADGWPAVGWPAVGWAADRGAADGGAADGGTNQPRATRTESPDDDFAFVLRHLMPPAFAYPAARREPRIDIYHGVSIADPYRWLEAPAALETRVFVQSQNEFTQRYFQATSERQRTRGWIRQRLETLTSYDAASIPVRCGDRLFYLSNESGGSQPALMSRRTEDAQASVVLAPDSLPGYAGEARAVGDGSLSLSGWRVSHDGRYLAYGVRRRGADRREIRVRDLATRKDFPERLSDAPYCDLIWTSDHRGFYYCRIEADGRHAVYLHRVGEEQTRDARIWARAGRGDGWLDCALSDDGACLVIRESTGLDRDHRVFVVDCRHPRQPPRQLFAGLDAQFQFAGGHQGTLWFATDLEAPRGRVIAIDLAADLVADLAVAEAGDDAGDDAGSAAVLMTDRDRSAIRPAAAGTAGAAGEADAAGVASAAFAAGAARVASVAGATVAAVIDKQTSATTVYEVAEEAAAPCSLRTVVPESIDTLIYANLVGGKLVLRYLHDAASRVHVHRLDGERAYELKFSTPGTVAGLDGRSGDADTFFAHSTYTSAPCVYRLDVATGRCELFHRPRVPFRANDYETVQASCLSPDGTRVPLTLVGRRGLPRNGDRPTLLVGYGGFNIPLTPAFSLSNCVWLEMGGLLAVAHVRGGGEFGREWHAAGRRHLKPNAIDDFIAAAEWLVRQGYTRPNRLAISGRSNGGMLVGAAMTRRPELFAAALPGVAVLDMLRFHQWPLGRAWIPEYGSVDDPRDFATLFSYSPLHQLRPGRVYPATLITTAEHDDRVPPAHSLKFAAALQACQAGDRPILLRIDARSGHGGGASTSTWLDATADSLTFLADTLNAAP